MKRFLLSVIVALVAIVSYAQPKKTLASVVVAPEHSDWHFAAGIIINRLSISGADIKSPANVYLCRTM